MIFTLVTVVSLYISVSIYIERDIYIFLYIYISHIILGLISLWVKRQSSLHFLRKLSLWSHIYAPYKLSNPCKVAHYHLFLEDPSGFLTRYCSMLLSSCARRLLGSCHIHSSCFCYFFSCRGWLQIVTPFPSLFLTR